MIEREMQELLWQHPERLLNGTLKPFAWEVSSPNVGRADLVFKDRHGGFLIVEVKRGTLPRGAIDQLLDYFGMMKSRFPDKAVELMVVANTIPNERQITCANYNIECCSISEKAFRDVAAEVGYIFASETDTSGQPVGSIATSSSKPAGKAVIETPTNWLYGRTPRSAGTTSVGGNEQEFLSRCDSEGKIFFAALFKAQKADFHQSKITWNHESGFSIQFYFHRLGYAPMLWGFPAKNREGKNIRERLDFPFNSSLKAKVAEAFVHEFGASLSSLVPFSGGGKRPSIPIADLTPGTAERLIETIFNFASRASQK
jgi:hypothetical protein